ncbi:hypothetical protein SFRURICE_006557 [Spodoptera frugiperda]|nr:hypothetical protein SFRURICE_006557 [Spodoptera frugiperda]
MTSIAPTDKDGNGTEKSVQDIITLLKVTDPDDVPAFVAKDLHKLPPVTFDHVDVTTLLKDIISLKTSLAEVQSKLMSSENTIGELRAELMALRNTVVVSGSPTLCTDDANTCRGAANASVSSLESAQSQKNKEIQHESRRPHKKNTSQTKN